MPEKDFETLAAAMIVDSDYNRKVMDPNTRDGAIDSGYLTYQFNFTEEERKLIRQITTEKFAEFGAQLNKIKKKLNS